MKAVIMVGTQLLFIFDILLMRAPTTYYFFLLEVYGGVWR